MIFYVGMPYPALLSGNKLLLLTDFEQLCILLNKRFNET